MMLRYVGLLSVLVFFMPRYSLAQETTLSPNHAEVAVATGAQTDDAIPLGTRITMEVGPTVNYPLPKNYLEATEKYSSQVKIVELPDGGLTLTGYQGGIPFPNPEEPHKGWKVLANLWYRYMPHLIVDTYASACTQSGGSSSNCGAEEAVYRQLRY